MTKMRKSTLMITLFIRMGPEPLVGVESLVGMSWLVDQGPGILEQIRNSSFIYKFKFWT